MTDTLKISNEEVRFVVDELVKKLREKGDTYALGYLSQHLYFNVAYNLTDGKKEQEIKAMLYAIENIKKD